MRCVKLRAYEAVHVRKQDGQKLQDKRKREDARNDI